MDALDDHSNGFDIVTDSDGNVNIPSNIQMDFL